MPRLSNEERKVRKDNVRTIMASKTGYGPQGMQVDDALAKLPAGLDKGVWGKKLENILDPAKGETVVKDDAKVLARILEVAKEDLLTNKPWTPPAGAKNPEPTTKLGQAYAQLLKREPDLTHDKVAEKLANLNGEEAPIAAALAGLLIDEPDPGFDLEGRLVTHYNIWGDADDKPKGKGQQKGPGAARPKPPAAKAPAATKQVQAKKKSAKKKVPKKPAAPAAKPAPAPVAAKVTARATPAKPLSPVMLTKAMALRLIGTPIERNGTGFIVHLPDGERPAIEKSLRKTVKNADAVIFDALWASATSGAGGS
jgi:hypothetical protein